MEESQDTMSNLQQLFQIYWIQFVEKSTEVRKWINSSASEIEPLFLILSTVCITAILSLIWHYWNSEEDVLESMKRKVFSIAKKLPFVRGIVAKEMKKAVREIRHSTEQMLIDIKFLQDIPKEGWTKEKILEEVKRYQSLGTVNWRGGRASGTVYGGNSNEMQDLITEVYRLTSWSNPLHADVFPGVIKMETEITKIACKLFGANENACGMVTSGGTESIILACKAYRDYARYIKGIASPEMIIPITAHAAFEKAAKLLGMRIRMIPINTETMQVNVKAMKKAITKNACMLVGSAPQFPHGIIDPIEDIAKLGAKYNIPVHVDACLGGFLLPFMESAGFDIPPCNFRLQGVTSISADTHKYGYAPKGSSVIMYRDTSFLHSQYSVQTDWPGGVYATPNLGGSRAGSNIATCWAAMMYYGGNGYVDNTRKVISTSRYIESGLREIPGLIVYGKPQMSVVAVGSNVFDVFRLVASLSGLGWNLNRLQYPSGFHFCVTLQHTMEGVADQFLEDIKECTQAIMKDPKTPATGMAAMYGVAASLPDRSIVAELASAFVDSCYDVDAEQALGIA